MGKSILEIKISHMKNMRDITEILVGTRSSQGWGTRLLHLTRRATHRSKEKRFWNRAVRQTNSFCGRAVCLVHGEKRQNLATFRKAYFAISSRGQCQRGGLNLSRR